MRCDAARGKARIFCSLFSHLQKGAAFICERSGRRTALFPPASDVCSANLQLPWASQEMLSAKGDCGGELIFLMG
ncbi:hypothetical protein HMPREF9166_0305 [Selenomonas sp. oral taxon 149 str. 67H29BP]|nr:hypothetical protein HMPREF9166_0305 [Selenomonas sp. oral taxon 149 str. 67H29BP]